jgi:hypothetical protein
MKARDTIKIIIDTGIAGIALDAGFKKSGFNFFRRQDLVVQVINVQLSRWNRGDTGSFYVNVALAFDELRKHEAIPIIETPKDYECDFRRRLEHIIPDTPFAWEISPQVDSKLLSRILLNKISVALKYLDAINSLPTFLEIALEEKWFALPGEYDLLGRNNIGQHLLHPCLLFTRL